MKSTAVILLAALAIAVFSPVSFTVTGRGEDRSVLVNLDVCHSSAPALAGNGEMPALSESSCKNIPFQLVVLSKTDKPASHQFILSAQNDRPPKT